MAASRQLQVPFYRGIRWQHARVFDAPAQVIPRTAIPLLRKKIVQAAKHVGADLLELVWPEHPVVGGWKNSKKLEWVWEGEPWENNRLVVLSRAGSLQQNLPSKSVGRVETFLQKCLVDQVKNFSIPNNCGSFWKAGRESPSSWRYTVIPSTRNSS